MLGPDNSATKQKLIHSLNWKEGKLAVFGGFFLVLHLLLVAFFLPVVPHSAHLEEKKSRILFIQSDARSAECIKVTNMQWPAYESQGC